MHIFMGAKVNVYAIWKMDVKRKGTKTIKAEAK